MNDQEIKKIVETVVGNISTKNEMTLSLAKKLAEKVEAEAKRLIEECLLINPYILSVDVTSTSFKDSTLTCDIKITTIYGDMEVNI